MGSSGYSGGGSGSLQSSGARKQELRWRASPDLLVALATRSKIDIKASNIDRFGHIGDMLDSALPTFLSVLSQLFPRPPSSQPDSPADDNTLSGDDGKIKPASSGTLPRSAAHAFPDCFANNYSPASVYFLELAISLIMRSPEHATFDTIAPPLAVGIERLLDTDAKTLLSSPTNWDIIRSLLKRLAHAHGSVLVPACGDTARRLLTVLVEIVILLKCGAIEPAVYLADVLDTLTAFMPSDRALAASGGLTAATTTAKADNSIGSDMSAAEAASKLIVLLYDLQDIAKSHFAEGDVVGSPVPSSSSPSTAGRQLPRLSGAQTEPSVTSAVSAQLSVSRQAKSTPLAMWTSVMNGLVAYVCVGNRDVRQLACSYIQRAISGNFQGVHWVSSAFHRVLFPLMDMLQRADLLADNAMEDTHARCISMVTMFFLHNASGLQGCDSSKAQATSPQLRSAQHVLHGQSQACVGDTETANAQSDVVMSNARESTPALNRIWLRLIGTLCVYMHTSKMASEACMSDATSGADAAADRRHGHLG
ncbi:hypothetical protein GGH92_008807, partial [Coemansia sp. RSA 2673]